MIEALTVATAGMLTALQSAGSAARTIAASSAPSTQGPAAVPRVSPSNSAERVSADTLSAFTSLLEAEMSFKANAAVVRTSSQMIEALYKAVD